MADVNWSKSKRYEPVIRKKSASKSNCKVKCIHLSSYRIYDEKPTERKREKESTKLNPLNRTRKLCMFAFRCELDTMTTVTATTTTSTKTTTKIVTIMTKRRHITWLMCVMCMHIANLVRIKCAAFTLSQHIYRLTLRLHTHTAVASVFNEIKSTQTTVAVIK